MNEKHLDLFFEHYGIVFWFLYLIFPFFFRKFLPAPLYLVLVFIILAIYIKVMYEAYKVFATQNQFVVDAGLILVGVILLNSFVFLGSTASTVMDLGTYLFMSLTFAPTALRLESYKNSLAVR